MEEFMITVEAEANPTESGEKVKKAIENLFGNMQIQTRTEKDITLIVATAKSKDNLTRLYNILRRERIRAAARKVLLEGLEKKTIVFCLNKQVAYAGQVSFANEVAESPLGPLRVKIESNNPRALVDWLTRMEREV
jgi:predicted RNA binding protein with dsRBD fold (UPF0201 family)